MPSAGIRLGIKVLSGSAKVYIPSSHGDFRKSASSRCAYFPLSGPAVRPRPSYRKGLFSCPGVRKRTYPHFLWSILWISGPMLAYVHDPKGNSRLDTNQGNHLFGTHLPSRKGSIPRVATSFL
jgi:hypothetical protein